ncbi:MAG: holo-ACP synthase [bacterium]|jgi:holo-[acyl-carrier protein] synthase|nr:holo-ACP synthase [Phycisphaerales bacterium]MCE2652705.1 holo-ACP synthase [Planctomycetaceae bacterium]
MRIVGHGIDLVPVERIAGMLAEHGERFLLRTFTARERADCAGHRREAERLASRFAAKEAVFKALGTGMRDGMTLLDVSVEPLATGQPTLVLAGVAAEKARQLGITSWSVSLTDTEGYSAASVLALGE